MAIKGLLESLREGYPGKQFVLSTVTPTGNHIAKGLTQGNDFITYLPLDFSFLVRSVIKRIEPSLFIIAETEIWPNLISELYKNKIPLVVVNGRISAASFRGYLSIKFLVRPILNKISLFCVQSKADAERLERLGLAGGRVRVSGNMKFDLKPNVLNFSDLKIRLSEDEQLLVCGSTHSGEEGMILGVYKRLLAEFPKLKLLIAPRHPERSSEIARIVFRNRFQPIFLSRLPPTTNDPAWPAGRQRPTTVFILDTIGQLFSYYAIADIVFVGGSLAKIGGHNILEPAWQEKPVIFGPHMFNFRDIVDLFLQEKAAIQVHNPEELQEKIKYLLENPAATKELTARARDLIMQNQGATSRNSEIIKGIYAGISL